MKINVEVDCIFEEVCCVVGLFDLMLIYDCYVVMMIEMMDGVVKFEMFEMMMCGW